MNLSIYFHILMLFAYIIFCISVKHVNFKQEIFNTFSPFKTLKLELTQELPPDGDHHNLKSLIPANATQISSRQEIQHSFLFCFVSTSFPTPLIIILPRNGHKSTLQLAFMNHRYIGPCC